MAWIFSCPSCVMEPVQTSTIIQQKVIMKKYSFLPLLALLLSLSSCEVVGGIFKAGVWSGVILIVVVVGLVIFILAKLFGGGKS